MERKRKKCKRCEMRRIVVKFGLCNECLELACPRCGCCTFGDGFNAKGDPVDICSKCGAHIPDDFCFGRIDKECSYDEPWTCPFYMACVNEASLKLLILHKKFCDEKGKQKLKLIPYAHKRLLREQERELGRT